jgi:hypothetical protein
VPKQSFDSRYNIQTCLQVTWLFKYAPLSSIKPCGAVINYKIFLVSSNSKGKKGYIHKFLATI